MELSPDSVAHVVSNNGAILLRGVRLDHPPDITESIPWADGLDAQLQTPPRDLGQMLRLVTRRADVEGRARITMKPIEIDGDVDVDDVTIFELLVPTRNTMTNTLIEGRTDALGITAIVERRRCRAMLKDKVMNDVVDLEGRDSGLDERAGVAQRLRCQLT